MTDWWREGIKPAVTPTKRERIRDAALRLFAEHGVGATSLRDVAVASEVSLGSVQHHFGTKDQLVAAIDEYVLMELSAVLTGPPDREIDDAVAQHGHRVMTLITTRPTIADYVGRALVDGRAFGSRVFDGLVASGTQRWIDRSEQRLTAPDLDLTWAALNPLILVLGTIILRGHVDRHLPDPLTNQQQADRWMEAVNTLIRDGLYRH